MFYENQDFVVSRAIPMLTDEEAKRQLRALFAKRLVDRMTAREFTQGDLSRRAGLSKFTICKYCRAEILPTLPTLVTLARALSVDEGELIPRERWADLPKTRIPTKPKPLRITTKNGSKQLEIAAVEGAPGQLRLCLNQVVTIEQAAKIAAMLDEDRNDPDSLAAMLRDAAIRFTKTPRPRKLHQ